jgi:hypothetical protein
MSLKKRGSFKEDREFFEIGNSPSRFESSSSSERDTSPLTELKVDDDSREGTSSLTNGTANNNSPESKRVLNSNRAKTQAKYLLNNGEQLKIIRP